MAKSPDSCHCRLCWAFVTLVNAFLHVWISLMLEFFFISFSLNYSTLKALNGESSAGADDDKECRAYVYLSFQLLPTLEQVKVRSGKRILLSEKVCKKKWELRKHRTEENLLHTTWQSRRVKKKTLLYFSLFVFLCFFNFRLLSLVCWECFVFPTCMMATTTDRRRGCAVFISWNN